MNPAFTQQWLAQRLLGIEALVRVADEELAQLTPEQALVQIDALLELGANLPPDSARLGSSGFVEQQALFARMRM